MNCPTCRQEASAGSSFCGNCGQPLLAEIVALPAQPAIVTLNLNAVEQPAISVANSSPIAQVYVNQAPTAAAPVASPTLPLKPAIITDGIAEAPKSALAPVQMHGHVKPVLSIIFGVLGLLGALLPLGGIIFSIAGIILSTLTSKLTGRALKLTGLIISIIGLLVSLAAFVFVTTHNPRLQAAAKPVSKATASLSTPCYTVHFVHRINIENQSGSCALTAYDGATATLSTNIYKVLGSTVTNVSDASLATIAKPAIEQDVADTLPGFKIATEHSTQFAGSPAYVVNLYDQNKNVAAVEAAVFHATRQGSNFFVIVHANSGNSIDLKSLESSWQWK